MADRYLLESGSPDGYRLEDGSGVLILETTATYDAAFFASISQLAESFRNVRDRSLYQDGERKAVQGSSVGAESTDYSWHTQEENIRVFAQRAKLSTYHQTQPNDGWMAFGANIFYDPLTMSGWMAQLGGFRSRSSLRYQRDTNIDISWAKNAADAVRFFPAVVQLSESFRNVRDRSLYQDGEKKISAGNGGSGTDSGWDPSIGALSYWTFTEAQTRKPNYWSSDAPKVDWIAPALVVFDPATVSWAIPSHFPRKTRPQQISWTKSGYFVPIFYNPAQAGWGIDSQLVPGGPWWSSPGPNVDWIDPTISALPFDTTLRSEVIDSQRVPGKPYWTSQWQGNDWISPLFLGENPYDPRFEDWTIKTDTYKSRKWWTDSPQPQAWMVPSVKFDPKLWPATGIPSHRELPKAKGLWQPDLDNAWLVENPVVPNFFNASFVTNANIVEDAGGSPERSS